MINAPIAANERNQALDFLRGFAILGILIMNIQSFAMPGAAYLNPMAYGNLEGINKWVWITSHVFADQKFMTIFSILFGAGIMLMTTKAKTKSGKYLGLHFNRTFWLLVIGLIHAHLIWHGDILVPYAICAMLVIWFRNKSPKAQFITGIIVVSISSILYLFLGSSIEHWPPEALEGALSGWSPSAEQISEEIATVTGSLGQQISHNSQTALFMETFVFLFIFLWRAAGLMLIGMALFSWGVLTAERESAFYARAWLISWLIGLPIICTGVVMNFKAGWSIEYSMYLGSQFNYWGSLFMGFGFICAIMWVSRTERWPWLRDRLAAVGQMALTNYLMQSILCVFLFWGIGFGLFGRVDRITQVLVVVVIWILQITWSRPWLNTFRFGPFEWIWRSLTYRKLQAFIKTPGT